MCCTWREASSTSRARTRQASSHGANLVGRSKGVPQQSVGMQFSQPLAFLHVGLAPRQIPGIAGVHQKHLEPVLLQNIVGGNPIHSGGLHRHGLYSTRLHPYGHPLQIHRPGAEFPHRFGIAFRQHRHKMALIADVNSGRVGVQDLQPRIVRKKPAIKFPQLFAVQVLVVEPFIGGLLSLCHVIISSSVIRLGAARFAILHNLSNGVGPGLFQGSPPPITPTLKPKPYYWTGTKAPNTYRS